MEEAVIKYENTNGEYTHRMRFMETQFTIWWKSRYSEVFSSLMPFPKWSTKHRNLQVGDIVLVRYDHKYSNHDHRTMTSWSGPWWWV